MKKAILFLIITLLVMPCSALAEEALIPSFAELPTRQQLLVRLLHQAAREHQERVDLPKDTTRDETRQAMSYLLTEYTDIPALIHEWQIRYSDDTALGVSLYYSMTLQEEEEMNRLAAAIAGELISWADPQDLQLSIHDTLCRFLTYGGADDSLRHEAASAIIRGQAVCDGYAGAYAMLCRMAGIPCSIVTGMANGELHAWNIVAVRGGYAMVDITWNDQEWGVLHDYYHLTDEQALVDHQAQTEWRLPACMVPWEEYHAARRALIVRTDQIVPAIVQQMDAGQIELRFAEDAPFEAFRQNVQHWMREAFADRSVRYSYSVNERQRTASMILNEEYCSGNEITINAPRAEQE